MCTLLLLLLHFTVKWSSVGRLQLFLLINLIFKQLYKSCQYFKSENGTGSKWVVTVHFALLCVFVVVDIERTSEFWLKCQQLDFLGIRNSCILLKFLSAENINSDWIFNENKEKVRLHFSESGLKCIKLDFPIWYTCLTVRNINSHWNLRIQWKQKNVVISYCLQRL
jgi:hypothetical protein